MNDQDRLEKEGLEQLARIEENLEEIKERTPTPRRAFLTGILQGAGAVVGGIAAIILLGWILSLLGILPGFSSIAHYLQDVSDRVQVR